MCNKIGCENVSKYGYTKDRKTISNRKGGWHKILPRKKDILQGLSIYMGYNRTQQLQKLETLSIDRYMDGSKYNDN